MPRFIGRDVDGLNHLNHMAATRGRRILRIGNNMTWSSEILGPNFYLQGRGIVGFILWSESMGGPTNLKLVTKLFLHF
jgi:hypothetical protein